MHSCGTTQITHQQILRVFYIRLFMDSPQHNRATPATGLQMALLAGLMIAIIYCLVWYFRRKNESFVSRRARTIHTQARKVFQGGDASYSDYKRSVLGADPVQYTDLRSLYRAGRLTPASVQNIM